MKTSLWALVVRLAGECCFATDRHCPVPDVVFLQECVHSGDWKHLAAVCEHPENLYSSPAVDMASDLEVFGGIISHPVAISSGCVSSARALT